MSYSFMLRAADKAAAKAAAIVKFDEATAAFPDHDKDRGAAFANVDATLALLDDEDRDIVLAMSGSLGGPAKPDGTLYSVNSAHIGVTAYYTDREA